MFQHVTTIYIIWTMVYVLSEFMSYVTMGDTWCKVILVCELWTFDAFFQINLRHFKVLDSCLNCMNVLHKICIQYDNTRSLLLVCVWERVMCFLLPTLIMFPPYNLQTQQFQIMATLWKSINGRNEGEMTSHLTLYFVAMYKSNTWST
jgi:hypothetical protein